MAKRIRVTCLGGGSRFTVSVAHGFLPLAKRLSDSEAKVEFALYDAVPENAERIARYIDLLARQRHLPLSAKVFKESNAALAGADIVFFSASSPSVYAVCERLAETYGMGHASDGLAGMYFLAGISRELQTLAKTMSRACPDTLFLDLVNPTDGITEYVRRLSGVQAVGLCAEPYQVRSHLAFYLGIPGDEIDMDMVGVNHNGWITGLRISGTDAYQQYHDQLRGLHLLPTFRDTPSHRGFVAYYRRSGVFRSSPYHNPFHDAGLVPCPEAVSAAKPERKAKECHQEAIDQALETGASIPDWSGHPHRGPLMYPSLGVHVARMALCRGLGGSVDAFGQVPNKGAVPDLPENDVLELPIRIDERGVNPISQEGVPEWIVESPIRSKAFQARAVVDWLVEGDEDKLRQAVFAHPPTANLEHVDEYLRVMRRAVA